VGGTELLTVPQIWWNPMLALTSLGSLMESITCLTNSVGMAGDVRRAKNQSAAAKVGNDFFGNVAKSTFRYLAILFLKVIESKF